MAKVSLKNRRKSQQADPGSNPPNKSWAESLAGKVEVLATKRQVAHRQEKEAKATKKDLSDSILGLLTAAKLKELQTPKHAVLVVEQEQSSIDKGKLMVALLKLTKDADKAAGIIAGATVHTPKRFITVREK